MKGRTENTVEWRKRGRAPTNRAVPAFRIDPKDPSGAGRQEPFDVQPLSQRLNILTKLAYLRGAPCLPQVRSANGCSNAKRPRRDPYPWESGGGGIRTHGRLAPTPVFETGPFNHSGTPPGLRRREHSKRTIAVITWPLPLGHTLRNGLRSWKNSLSRSPQGAANTPAVISHR